MIDSVKQAGIAILLVIVAGYICKLLQPARVKKEMCINANVMDEENFGKMVEGPCD